MHSYHNKLHPNHFDEYFIPISSTHSHSTRLATCNNIFLPRVNSSSGKCSLTFVGPKCDLQYQTILSHQPRLRLHGNCRNTSCQRCTEFEIFVSDSAPASAEYTTTPFRHILKFWTPTPAQSPK